MKGWITGLWVLVASSAYANETPEPESSDKETANEELAADTESPSESEEGDPPPEAAEAVEPSATETALQEQATRIGELEAKLAKLQDRMEKQRGDLSSVKRSLLPKDALSFDLEGHYRMRAHIFPNLFADQDRHARYMTHRLRVRPVLDYKGMAKLVMQVDALDNVIWGDNASLATTALFAADPTVTGLGGQELPSIRLSRVWMEAMLPIGSLRAGRMASHWGMGLLANDGNGFDDTWGENNGGNTFDRVLFATRPIAVAQAIMGKTDSEIPLFAAIGVDRLVEDPLIQYYGYECESGLTANDEGFEARCDKDGDGLTEGHGFTNEDRVAGNRGLDWWADQNDDVWEVIYVLIYKGEDIHYLGGIGDLTAGAYVINRIQKETDSNVWIADVYLKAAVRGFKFEFEGLTIRGNTRAIALPGATSASGGDPLAKTADIWGYAGRFGYGQPAWEVMFEHGYASGDDNVADELFTGRPLHPDHNVGLLLYDEILARATAAVWSEGARALWSEGGVYNSSYVFPHVRYSPLDNWDLRAGFIMAFPDRADGAVIRCKNGDNCTATAGSLGWEVVFAAKHRWHEHLLFSVEGAYASVTDRVPLENMGLNPEGRFFTLQSRLAYEF